MFITYFIVDGKSCISVLQLVFRCRICPFSDIVSVSVVGFSAMCRILSFSWF